MNNNIRIDSTTAINTYKYLLQLEYSLYTITKSLGISADLDIEGIKSTKNDLWEKMDSKTRRHADADRYAVEWSYTNSYR